MTNDLVTVAEARDEENGKQETGNRKQEMKNGSPGRRR
jgi:hypothetical protein